MFAQCSCKPLLPGGVAIVATSPQTMTILGIEELINHRAIRNQAARGSGQQATRPRRFRQEPGRAWTRARSDLPARCRCILLRWCAGPAGGQGISRVLDGHPAAIDAARHPVLIRNGAARPSHQFRSRTRCLPMENGPRIGCRLQGRLDAPDIRLFVTLARLRLPVPGCSRPTCAALSAYMALVLALPDVREADSIDLMKPGNIRSAS